MQPQLWFELRPLEKLDRIFEILAAVVVDAHQGGALSHNLNCDHNEYIDDGGDVDDGDDNKNHGCSIHNAVDVDEANLLSSNVERRVWSDATHENLKNCCRNKIFYTEQKNIAG